MPDSCEFSKPASNFSFLPSISSPFPRPPPLSPNHTSPHQPLDADWQADCLIPNTRAALVYKYGPEAPKWALAYTISGAKYDIRMKTMYHYDVEDPYFFESPSHARAYLNVASYAGYPKHLTWQLISDTVKAVGECTIGKGVNRTIRFHVAFVWGRVAMGELMYLPSGGTGVDGS